MQCIDRNGWGAAAPKTAFTPLAVDQLLGMAVHYEDGPYAGDHTECDDAIRSVQAFHQHTRGWNDIAYSWLVCAHGIVYEGRGWLHRTAAQGTPEGNRAYHAVCALGGAHDPVHDFTPEQKHGLFEVISEARRRGYGHELRPHSSFHATSCPGDPIRGWVLAGAPYANTQPAASSRPQVTAPGNSSHAIAAVPGSRIGRSPSHPGFPPYAVTLRVRTAGHAVTVWQRQMVHRGYQLAVDGLYGPASSDVCALFQHRAALTGVALGVVDRQTWEAAFTLPLGYHPPAHTDGAARADAGVSTPAEHAAR